MKASRVAAIVLGGIVALPAAAVILIAAAFDASQWKGEIARLVQDKMQRSLKIEGELSLSLFPDIGVRLGRTTLSEHRSEQVFASLEKGRISLRLLPLLTGRVAADTVELDGLKARLVRFKDGRLNIDDLLARDDRAPPPRFDIAGVKLANGELAWRDEVTGAALTIVGLTLAAGRLANAAADTFDLSARLAGNNPGIAAQFKAAGQYRYDLDLKSYGGAKLDLRLTGDVADLKALELGLTAAMLQFDAANGLAADSLQLTAKGGSAFEAKLALPYLAAKSQSLQSGGLVLDFAARQGETTVQGRLASALSADPEKQTVELPAISGELAVAHPQLPMGRVRLPLAGGLRADIGGQAATLHAHSQFDGSRIAARVDISHFSPLALGFDLDIDRLNVDKYLPPKGAAAGEKAPEKPIGFPALMGLNASGTVKIGQLQAANVKAGNVRLEVRAANGKLDVGAAGAAAAMK